MPNLTPSQKENAIAIMSEALNLIPHAHHDKIITTLLPLSEFAACEPAYLTKIQRLIDLARQNNMVELKILAHDVDLLRNEVITAFNNVGNEIDSLNHRVQKLENQPQARRNTNLTINFDNTSNAIMWVIISTLIIGTVGTLLTPVVDSYQHQKMEVNSHE
ncbi:MAG TPA: hypothetical protein DDW56_04480 [Cyanobacteria bacterium UBA11366]|nr:hypothetical protein [Cyanobacteria bacterium UBA11366]HCA94648.1 hypothetical protein [Cyanobacteria bacterium UBA9226]